MRELSLLVLPGDGIGPEVTAEALRVLHRVARQADVTLTISHGAFGGASLDAHGVPATDALLDLACGSGAVLLGAVGGPKWDALPSHLRPERGLLALRKAMGVYANLRPARFFDALADASPLKRALTEGVDLVVVRELTGGIYFGEPRGVFGSGDARRGVNTLAYSEMEIRRIGRVAFELAMRRDKRLTSVDKSNVLEVMALWREVMISLSAEYPEVTLDHLYVDNCAMQLVSGPRQFDVIVTGNLFGDILSDEAAALTGSLGMLPSASIGDGPGLFEPVHGTAPDIAGKGLANPLATILSVAMLVEHALGRRDLALAIERAVENTLSAGHRTGDIARGGEKVIGTAAMGDAVLAELDTILKSEAA